MKKSPTKKQTQAPQMSVAPVEQSSMNVIQQQMIEMQKMMQKMFVIVIILVVAIGGILVKDFVLKKEAAPTPTTATTAAQPGQQVVTLDQVKNTFKQAAIKFGDTGKKLVFIEVTDPSCPYCHAASGRNSELNNQMGDRFKLSTDGGTYVAPVPEMEKLVKSGKAAMAIVYTPGHGNGEMGMKALYCANDQGKYWEAQDLMYTNAGYELLNNTVKNDKTQTQTVVDFLSSVVDGNALKNCMDSGKYDARLAEDVKLASAVGVSGTPGFFVNATAFAGAYSFNDMKSAVDAAL